MIPQIKSAIMSRSKWLSILCFTLLLTAIGSVNAAETGTSCPGTNGKLDEYRNVEIVNQLEVPVTLHVDRKSWSCSDWEGSRTPATLDRITLQPGQKVFRRLDVNSSFYSSTNRVRPFSLNLFACSNESCSEMKGHTIRLGPMNGGSKCTNIYNEDEVLYWSGVDGFTTTAFNSRPIFNKNTGIEVSCDRSEFLMRITWRYGTVGPKQKL